MFRKKLIASSIVLAGSLGLMQAAQAARPGFYFGASIGQGHDMVLEQNSAAGKIFGGYNLNRFLGLELSYVNLGSSYTDVYNNSFTQEGVSYEVVGYLPISPTVDLFGKVGMFNWTASNNYYYYASVQGTDSDYGFGISARATQQLWVRGEYQKFNNVDGGDVNLVSVGLSYHFF